MGAQGTTTVNFGTYPGKTDASVTVTGQTSIAADSLVEAWILPIATADHNVDEHIVEPIKVVAGNIVIATGFTIYASTFNTSANPINENNFAHGRFTVAWVWN